MSKDIDKLKELIHPCAIVVQEIGRYGDQMVVLREAKEPCSEVRVDGIPADTIVFNLDDNFDPPERIFVGNKGECCRSDFIFISDSDYKVVVCAELKKSKDDACHIKNQLNGATAFVGYCKKILKQFWKYDFRIEDYEFHYVAFQNAAKKTGSRNNSSDNVPNTSVDSFMKLDGGLTFRFQKIIQKHG